MRDQRVIKNHAAPQLRIAAEPLLNILCSVCLLNQEVQNLSPWVDHTRSSLSPEDLRSSDDCCGAASFVPDAFVGPFEEWLDRVAVLSVDRIGGQLMDAVLGKALRYLPGRSIPDRKRLMADPRDFAALMREVYAAAGMEAPEDEIEREYRSLLEPAEWRDRTVAFLRRIWNDSLKDEWALRERQVEDTVRAFNEIEIPGTSLEEKLRYVTGRDSIPETWMSILSRMEEVVWVPSPHIGPYMLLFHHTDRSAYFMSRTRLPSGSSVHSVQLDRSDLLVRLAALSDPIRLEMIRMAAVRGAITTQTAMDELSLTQSSASRHLIQLSATGILTVDSGEKTKKYSLNIPRYEEIILSLRGIADLRDSSGGN